MAKKRTDYEGYTDAEKLLALVGSADWSKLAVLVVPDNSTVIKSWSELEWAEASELAINLLRQICQIVRPDLMEGEDD